MSERDLSRRLCAHLHSVGWDAQRHEDMYSAGIPDLSFAGDGVDGWLELKHLKGWPARAATLVRLDRDTMKITRQLVWLRRRAALGGGRCGLLAQVGPDVLLFGGPALRDDRLATGCSRAWLERLACARWHGPLPAHELARELRALRRC